jgi:serum/glucocorticoid-regulated kinase 2
MYEKILQDPLVFGSEISSEAQSILTGLLTRDPAKRLGVNGAEEIKRHPFFGNHIDFARLLEKKIQPPFKPSVASPVDVSNFDTVFTTEPALDSLVEDSHLSQTVQAQFAGKRTNRMFFFWRTLMRVIRQVSPTMGRTCPSAPSNHLPSQHKP